MDIQYYGANCIKITTKKIELMVDPVSDIVKITPSIKKANVVVATQPQLAVVGGQDVFDIGLPGEYELADLSVKGIAAQPHTGSSGDLSATIYKISTNDQSILILGHINQKLDESQLEEIGMIDIMVLPVGGGGYTLDGVEAAQVVRTVEPKVVIPVHSADDGLTYSVPQDKTELFLKEIGVAPEEAIDRYKPKSIPEQLSVQLLNRQ